MHCHETSKFIWNLLSFNSGRYHQQKNMSHIFILYHFRHTCIWVTGHYAPYLMNYYISLELVWNDLWHEHNNDLQVFFFPFWRGWGSGAFIWEHHMTVFYGSTYSFSSIHPQDKWLINLLVRVGGLLIRIFSHYKISHRYEWLKWHVMGQLTDVEAMWVWCIFHHFSKIWNNRFPIWCPGPPVTDMV